MRIRRLVTLVVSAGMAMWLALPAQAATVTTKIVGVMDGFSPTVTSGGMGSTFAWKNNDSITHTSTQNSPLVLWDTRDVSPGATKSTVINFAGSYPYHCNIHPTMTGTVKVPIIVTPATGTTSTTFTVKLATVAQDPMNSLVYDVQMKVGSGSFANFKTGVKTMSVAFHPTATGTYTFRSRFRDKSTTAKSGYSPGKTITVS